MIGLTTEPPPFLGTAVNGSLADEDGFRRQQLVYWEVGPGVLIVCLFPLTTPGVKSRSTLVDLNRPVVRTICRLDANITLACRGPAVFYLDKDTTLIDICFVSYYLF